VHPFTAQPEAGQGVQQRVSLVIGDFRDQLGHCLVDVEWCAPRGHAHDLVQRVQTLGSGHI
jgi:hypothetical protein